MVNLDSIHALAYFNILKTSNWIEERVKNALKPFNLTHAQLNVLYIIYEKDPKPVSANELKNRILGNNPDTTRILDQLVKKELVLRETCSENRRKIDISFTDSGKLLFIKAHEATKNAVHNFFEDKISIDEAKELRRILHKTRV